MSNKTEMTIIYNSSSFGIEEKKKKIILMKKKNKLKQKKN